MPDSPPPRWLNRSTVGVSLASFFSDVSHETATAVLPTVLLALGAGAGALGIIEGCADGISAVAKLWGGVQADRLKRHQPLAAVGYLATAAGTAAIGWCTAGWQILLCRMVAWTARGSRSASRDVLLVSATPPEHQGKVFGLERAGDAFGAVIGPLLALTLIAAGTSPSHVMRWSLVPGVLAFLAIAVVVSERPAELPAKPRTLKASLAGTGRRFHGFLGGLFLFGCGDFSRTLLILYATQHLGGPSAASLAIGLYVLHNAVSSLAAFPLGVLTDRIGRAPVVIGGYASAAASTGGFALLAPTAPHLIALFIGSGIAVACVEVAEKAYAVELLPKEVKGTGLGALAAVNGIGDWVSSAAVGGLWATFPKEPAIGLGAAALLQLLGALVVGMASRQTPSPPRAS